MSRFHYEPPASTPWLWLLHSVRQHEGGEKSRRTLMESRCRPGTQVRLPQDRVPASVAKGPMAGSTSLFLIRANQPAPHRADYRIRVNVTTGFLSTGLESPL
jgi:hypothetical protein